MWHKAECVENDRIKVCHGCYKVVRESIWISRNLCRLFEGLASWIQECATVAYRPRSGSSPISSDDVGRLQNSFQEYPKESLTSTTGELNVLFSTIRSVSRKVWNCFGTRFLYWRTFFREAVTSDFIRHRLFVYNWSLILATWREFSSLLIAFHIPMDLSTIIMQECVA